MHAVADPLLDIAVEAAVIDWRGPAPFYFVPHMRYYGFYCWLGDSYAREVGSTDYEAWRQWVRRGEALLALAASRAAGPSGEGAGGIGGIRVGE